MAHKEDEALVTDAKSFLGFTAVGDVGDRCEQSVDVTIVVAVGNVYDMHETAADIAVRDDHFEFDTLTLEHPVDVRNQTVVRIRTDYVPDAFTDDIFRFE